MDADLAAITASEDNSPARSHTGPLVQIRQPREPAPVAPREPSRPPSTLLGGKSEGIFRRRKLTNRIMLTFAGVCAVIALIPLLAIAIFVVVQGVGSLNWNFFTHAQADVDLFGNPLGIGNTVIGTVLLVACSCVFGLPIGLFSGIYLAEYGRGRFATTIRFLADVIAGLPSIVAGMVGFAVIVIGLHIGFSVIAGGFALALLMFPVVTRATEEVLRLVPNSLREGGLALGLPRWRVIASIVVPTAASGIVTSMLLGVARVTGETAPLLFTSFDNQNWNWNPMHAVGALTVMIYNYTTNEPTDLYHQMAFAGALVLIAVVVVLNVVARFLFRQSVRGQT